MKSVKKIIRETFVSLKIYNYRLFFFGQAISLSGSWMQAIAQSWLVLKLTNSGTALGIVTALQFLPILLFGAWGGVIADRFSKRKILYFTQSAAALLALVLGALVATGLIKLWMVYILASLLGLVNAVDNPARQTFVFEMVGKDYLSNAVTLNSTIVALARVIGPAIGGILIEFIGLAPCFFINGVSFLAVLIVLYRMRPGELFAVPRVKRAKGQLMEGLKYVRSTPILRNSLIMMAIIGTFTYEYNVALPLIAKFTFNGGATSYAALTSAMGVGSIFAVFTVARVRKVSSRQLIISAFLLGASTLAASVAPSLVLALVALAVVGYFSANFVPFSNSILQLESAPEMRGRVLSLWAVAFLGSTPVGGPIIGLIGEYAGPRWTLAAGGLAALAAVGLSYISLSRANLADKITPDMEIQAKETVEKERTSLQPRI